MVKLTVLYKHPTNPEAFETYYAQTHFALAMKIGRLVRLEATKFTPGPDGAQPAYFRMGELWFASEADMQSGLGSSEGQAAVADLANFATGGVVVLTGSAQVLLGA